MFLFWGVLRKFGGPLATDKIGTAHCAQAESAQRPHIQSQILVTSRKESDWWCLHSVQLLKDVRKKYGTGEIMYVQRIHVSQIIYGNEMPAISGCPNLVGNLVFKGSELIPPSLHFTAESILRSNSANQLPEDLKKTRIRNHVGEWLCYSTEGRSAEAESSTVVYPIPSICRTWRWGTKVIVEVIWKPMLWSEDGLVPNDAQARTLFVYSGFLLITLIILRNYQQVHSAWEATCELIRFVLHGLFRALSGNSILGMFFSSLLKFFCCRAHEFWAWWNGLSGFM